MLLTKSARRWEDGEDLRPMDLRGAEESVMRKAFWGGARTRDIRWD